MSFQNQRPIKPEIVLEGGNRTEALFAPVGRVSDVELLALVNAPATWGLRVGDGGVDPPPITIEWLAAEPHLCETIRVAP